MHSTTIRLGSKTFRDTQKFPYGFKKSGDFSISEANLLSTYGDTLFNLEFGSLNPTNVEEEHFVSVVRGETEAQSPMERLWLKYVKLSRGRKQFYTMHSSRVRDVDDADSSDMDDSDLELEA